MDDCCWFLSIPFGIPNGVRDLFEIAKGHLPLFYSSMAIITPIKWFVKIFSIFFQKENFGSSFDIIFSNQLADFLRKRYESGI